MKRCKRCEVKTVLSEAEINKMVDEVTHMRGIRLVSEEKYKERTITCESCGNLLYGQTCAKCGCIVEVRARLADGRCPDKKWL